MDVLSMIYHQGIELTFTWLTSLGSRCRKCISLNGQKWFCDGFIPDSLDVAPYGKVWDLVQNVSFTHPHCRCTIDVQVNVNTEKLEIAKS